MKTSHLFYFMLFCSSVSAQNWEAIADLKNQSVRQLYLDPVDSTLYISGHFRYVNDTIDARGIVKWDGEKFFALDTFPNIQCNNYNCNPVLSVIRYQNNIYASLLNSFPLPGQIRGIARWNGIKWDSLGAGVRGFVIEQVIFQDELYVMGRFDQAGQDTANSLAKWDGNSWHPVDFPYTIFEGGGGISINTAVVHNGELYVGGNFWNEDETVRDAAKFDGENWHPVGSPIKGGQDDINDLIVYKGELYACGDFRQAAGNVGNKIMKLENNEWVEVGGGFDSHYNIATRMTIFNDKLYVFGIFDSVGGGTPAESIAVWDGEKWCGLGSKIDAKIGDGLVFQGDLIIEGGFDSIDNFPIKQLARWTAGTYLDTCGAVVNTEMIYTETFKLSLFPNPTIAQVTLNLQNLPTQNRLQLKIFNTLGQQVASQSLYPAQQSEVVLDWSEYAKGTYFVVVEGVDFRAVERVVKY